MASQLQAMMGQGVGMCQTLRSICSKYNLDNPLGIFSINPDLAKAISGGGAPEPVMLRIFDDLQQAYHEFPKAAETRFYGASVLAQCTGEVLPEIETLFRGAFIFYPGIGNKLQQGYAAVDQFKTLQPLFDQLTALVQQYDEQNETGEPNELVEEAQTIIARRSMGESVSKVQGLIIGVETSLKSLKQTGNVRDEADYELTAFMAATSNHGLAPSHFDEPILTARATINQWLKNASGQPRAESEVRSAVTVLQQAQEGIIAGHYCHSTCEACQK